MHGHTRNEILKFKAYSLAVSKENNDQQKVLLVSLSGGDAALFSNLVCPLFPQHKMRRPYT